MPVPFSSLLTLFLISSTFVKINAPRTPPASTDRVTSAALSVLVDVVLLAVVTVAIAQRRAAAVPAEPVRRPDPAGIGPAQA